MATYNRRVKRYFTTKDKCGIKQTVVDVDNQYTGSGVDGTVWYNRDKEGILHEEISKSRTEEILNDTSPNIEGVFLINDEDDLAEYISEISSPIGYVPNPITISDRFMSEDSGRFSDGKKKIITGSKITFTGSCSTNNYETVLEIRNDIDLNDASYSMYSTSTIVFTGYVREIGSTSSISATNASNIYFENLDPNISINDARIIKPYNKSFATYGKIKVAHQVYLLNQRVQTGIESAVYSVKGSSGAYEQYLESGAVHLADYNKAMIHNCNINNASSSVGSLAGVGWVNRRAITSGHNINIWYGDQETTGTRRVL